jgi:hypothetical protein
MRSGQRHRNAGTHTPAFPHRPIGYSLHSHGAPPVEKCTSSGCVLSLAWSRRRSCDGTIFDPASCISELGGDHGATTGISGGFFRLPDDHSSQSGRASSQAAAFADWPRADSHAIKFRIREGTDSFSSRSCSDMGTVFRAKATQPDMLFLTMGSASGIRFCIASENPS